MSTGTGIEWTEATWNPVSGCTRASPGCDHCYAVPMSYRLEAMGQAKYHGLTVLNGKGERHFNGVVRTHDATLTVPLGWRKPRKVFVNSTSDLFHKGVPFDFIDKVFAVMALCPQHTFQILTKRPERMAEYMASRGADGAWAAIPRQMQTIGGDEHDGWRGGMSWPLPNVWLGTSVEDQQRADERIRHLRMCPAAVRFLSVEPLLGPVDLHDAMFRLARDHTDEYESVPLGGAGINWVIVGGESGPKARRFDVLWAESIVEQCRDAGVPVFVKQLGSSPFLGDASSPHGWPDIDGPVNFGTGKITLKDRKGGDMEEWPEALRVRQMPEGK